MPYCQTRRKRATAVRLGRYLDVEITLVHEARMVMPGFLVMSAARIPGSARPRSSVRQVGVCGGSWEHQTDPRGDPHGPHVPQELPDPARRAAEHQPALLVDHHRRGQARPAPHAQQHGTSYDIDGSARTFRLASHSDRQAPLKLPQVRGGPSPEWTTRNAPSHI